MAPIAASTNAKASDKAHVEAIFSELPEDLTAALIKKCAQLLEPLFKHIPVFRC